MRSALPQGGDFAFGDSANWSLGPQAFADGTPGGAEPQIRYGFRVGGRWFLVPADVNSEVSAVLHCARLPFTRKWCLGLANYRGDLVPVYDLKLILEEERDRKSGDFFLILGDQGDRVGLCIDDILFVDIPLGAASVPLPPLPDLLDGVDRRGITVDGTTFAEIDLASVLEILAGRACVLDAG